MKNIIVILLMILFIPGSCFADNLKIIMEEPTPQIDKVTFLDDDISIKFYLNNKNGISFDLKNLTNKVIKIDWNQTSILDLDQTAHKVIHTGILFTDRNQPQAPTVVPPIPNTRLTDTMFMLDHIAYEYDFWAGNRWVTHDFVTKKDTNKTLGVYLPLEIGGIVKNYCFNFRIKNVEP